VTPEAPIDEPIAFWDGTTFDHRRAAEHVREYAVHSRKD
jgi:hypothetical protein